MDRNKKRAIGYSFATMLILCGVLSVVVIEELFKNELLGIVSFFICLIPAVGIFVYLGCLDSENDVVIKKKVSKKHSLVSIIIWVVATFVFFIMQFMFGNASHAWVCFLIAFAIDSIVEGYVNYK